MDCWTLSITIILAAIVRSSIAQNTSSSICQEGNTCAECIQISASCVWCAQEDYTGVRCDSADNMLAANCTKIQNPEPYSINITKNEQLSNAGDAPLGQAVQVQPQEVHLKLRKGESVTIRMSVRQAEDYPVDLYYLMDLSQSMKEDLTKLTELAGDLVAEMERLTRDFRVGFGSFVDKIVIPFAAITSDGNPKLDCELGCETPYLFKNGLTLTNSTDLFETTLGETSYSTSKDRPEAGFDALMQVAVCDEAIGWRSRARHLVVFATDAPYHSAGDGRLGGIVTPNDGDCHVDLQSGYYTSEKLMDYPSLGHLSKMIQDKNIIVMFVVTEDVEPAYRDILPYIPGSQIGQLAADSSNILHWISTLYSKITSEVVLSVQVPDELQLAFTSHCDDLTSIPGSMSCSNLAIGENVSFSIDVTAESCIEGSKSFTVNPIGFSETLTVNVEVICDCECENQGIANSSECNNVGTYACGQCACNPGSSGNLCQCSGEGSTSGDGRTGCVAPNSATVCSGRGECLCGECVCDTQRDPTHVVSGRYCQCDNFNCPLYNGKLCGGPDHGHCECDMATQQSKCVCTSEYMGDSCSCLRSREACIAPNGLICNAHGTCECGACKCVAESPFKGSACFNCATCSGQCEVYQECVQCKAFQTGPLTDQQCGMCNVEIIKVETFPDVDNTENCTVDHTDNCSIAFLLHFENGEETVSTIYVLEDTVCPVPPPRARVDPRWVAIGVAILIVVLGIICIILYKCYITWLDRKEFEEWEREKKNATFSENVSPIYKPASTVHKNPVYGTEISEEKSALPS